MVGALALGVVAGVLTEEPVKANNPDVFNPGMIISNELFYEPSTMTLAEIQTFLEQKGASCNDATCLKNYRGPAISQTPDRYCQAVEGGTLSAAEMIYRVANACSINPQVILVILQKEQSLLTTTSEWGHKAAMGYGCPDGLPCAGQYAGLFTQIYWGSRQFQIYRQRPELYARKVGVPQEIQYHPDKACGSQTVTIENSATLGLYLYTPYVPNAAKLAGAPDKCSSNGNYNFWNFYKSWFGNPLGGEGSMAMDDRLAAISALGAKVGNTPCLPKATECSQQYQNGAVYWSKSYGAWEVIGSAYQKLQAAGGVSSMGYPVGALGPVAVGSGNPGAGKTPTINAQQFAGGLVVVDGGTSYAVKWPEKGEADLERGLLFGAADGSIKTGAATALKDTDGIDRIPLTAVARGDVSGDGEINLTDLVKVGRHLAGKESLDGVYLQAGDVLRSGQVDLTSLVRIGRHLAGKETL